MPWLTGCPTWGAQNTRSYPALPADRDFVPTRLAAPGRSRTGKWFPNGCGPQSDEPPWEGEFPRYVWYMHRNIVFEARLVNREIGSYKGYPLDNDEWPMGIEQVYAET
jgi:hypothetical protein